MDNNMEIDTARSPDATPPVANKRPGVYTDSGRLDREFDDLQAISGGRRATAVRSGGFLILTD
jgi:hypothetical protein